MRLLVIILSLCFFACRSGLSEQEKVHLTGSMLKELERRASYTDSLKVEIFLQDETARDYMVQLPGGGFAFSKEYKQKVAGNKPLYQLVEQCNLNVLTYGTLKSYVARELIRKIPGRAGDSLQAIYNDLR